MAAADGWRYFAQRMSGDGALGDFIDLDVPFQTDGPEEVLSGHNSLSGTISPEYMRLKGPDGRPILEEYGSALWAESPDGEVWGGLVTSSTFNGSEWAIECTDLTGVSVDLPYTLANFWVDVDPLNLFRYIWQYIQQNPGGDFGISIDDTTSPIRLGNELVQRADFDLEADPTLETPDEIIDVAPNKFELNADWLASAIKAMKGTGWKPKTVEDALTKWLNRDLAVQEKTWQGLTKDETKIKEKAIQKVGKPPYPPGGVLVVNMRPQVNVPTTADPSQASEEIPLIYDPDPYKLNWYTNLDLSSDIDDLAANTPFDWFLTHRWEGDRLRHHIRLGYPKLGRRLTDLRFVVGENINDIPSIDRDGSIFANEVLVLGAGEGSSQIMARSFRNDGRVRRVAVVSDPTIKTTVAAQQRAEQEIAARVTIEDIREVTLMNHSHAPMGSVSLGDEILVEGELGWIDISTWCRVIGRRILPQSDNMVLTLLRSDRVG